MWLKTPYNEMLNLDHIVRIEKRVTEQGGAFVGDKVVSKAGKVYAVVFVYLDLQSGYGVKFDNEKAMNDYHDAVSAQLKSIDLPINRSNVID